MRWGILGTGVVAREFTADLRHVAGARAVAVASRDPQRARAFARDLGLPRAHAGAEALADDAQVDVVYVATPPALHAEHARLCLEAGKPVLCEKPFGVSAAQARAVIELARERGLFCMEAMWMRFVPAVREALARVAAGAIGELRMLSAEFGVPAPASDATRFDPALGGGALLDRGVYPLSLAFALLGPPVEVQSVATSTASGVDEHAAILLRYAGGQVAHLAASLTAYTSNQAVLSGTRGRLTLHEPLCRPDRITLSAARVAASAAASGAGGLGQRLRAGLSHSPLGAALRSRLPVGASRSQTIRVPCVGHGYHYEAQEVGRCLRGALVESPLMPLDETLAILTTLDAIRGPLRSDG